jgi:cyanophycinase
MSIHLIGGGRSEDYAGRVYEQFIAEAAARGAIAGRDVPRLCVLLVGDPDEAGEYARAYAEQLIRTADCLPVMALVAEGDTLPSGGHTPSYLDAVAPIVDEIRLLVADGLPYAGFSAGAMIAADRAIIGGWKIGDIEVCAEETGEDLDEVTVVEGLGLVDLAIDVHAAQWGTLSRLVAATEAGLVDGGVAIDEFTVLIVGNGLLRVEGSGSVWRVVPHAEGTLVSTIGAGPLLAGPDDPQDRPGGQ